MVLPGKARDFDGVTRQKVGLESGHVAGRHRHRHHLRCRKFRAGQGWQPRHQPDPRRRVLHQSLALAGHLGPAVVAAKVKGCGHRKPCRRVARALHFQPVDERRVAERAFSRLMTVGRPAVADDQGVDQRLHGAADVQKGRTLGSHQPFVTIARIKVGPKRIQIQRDLPRRMCPVDHGPDAARLRLGHDTINGKDQSGGRGDVA